jgi:hypothetical protein
MLFPFHFIPEFFLSPSPSFCLFNTFLFLLVADLHLHSQSPCSPYTYFN